MHNPLKMQIDAATVAQLVDIFPPQEDEEALWSAIRTATNFEEALLSIYHDLTEAKCMVEAIALREDELAIRKKRYVSKVDRLREFIKHLMQAAKIRKAELPEATLFIGSTQPQPIIIDEAVIPEEFIRTTKSLDKAAIKDALKSGKEVAGAVLSNGGETLTIRSK